MPLATSVELSSFSLILSIFCFSCLGAFWLAAEIICLSGWRVNPSITGHVPSCLWQWLRLKFSLVASPLCLPFEGCCFVSFFSFSVGLWSDSLASSHLIYYVLAQLLFLWTIWGTWQCSRDHRVYLPSSDFLQININLVLVGKKSICSTDLPPLMPLCHCYMYKL